MSSIDAIGARLGGRWYHWLLLVASFVGGFAFSSLAARGHVTLGVLVGGLIAGALVGLRFLTDRTLVDEREEHLSRTVAYYTFCVASCGGGLLFLAGIALEQLGVFTPSERLVGLGMGIVALFVVYLAVDVIVRWRA